MEKKIKRSKLTTPQTLVLGVVLSILIGALLLKLPISNKSGKSLNYIDSLFTATSAVCVTGLSTVVSAEQFTIFGQIILMLLIEIGGIGFMSFIVLLLMILKKKINFSERLLIRDSLNQNNDRGLVKLIRKIFKYIVVIQMSGAILLSIRFIPEYGIKKGLFYSIFHSISAVCNAGFDILGSNSLINYQSDALVSVTIICLIIIGGLGFTVWDDFVICIKKIIKEKINITKAISEISIHTKLVIIMTSVLFITGGIFTFILEKDNVNTMKEDSISTKILKSSFYSATLRTAGFETVDTTALTTATKFISMIYMFIGGSSGSTAGGIKITTFTVTILMVYSFIRGENNTIVFKRKIPERVLKRAIVIIWISVFIIITAIIGLSITEDLQIEQNLSTESVAQREISFLDIFFEVFSAFGTVGLTVGITSRLTMGGKIIIMLLMFIGRVGPITLSYAVLKRSHIKQENINYPECDILVG